MYDKQDKAKGKSVILASSCFNREPSLEELHFLCQGQPFTTLLLSQGVLQNTEAHLWRFVDSMASLHPSWNPLPFLDSWHQIDFSTFQNEWRINVFFSPKKGGDFFVTATSYTRPKSFLTAVLVPADQWPEDPYHCQYKILGSQTNQSALNFAIRRGGDIGLRTDGNGYLLEGHHCNILYECNECRYTPSLSNIYLGTQLESLLASAQINGHRPLHQSELKNITRLWAVNSLLGIHPVDLSFLIEQLN